MKKLWFDTIDGDICRGGGNGPNHPSQFYGLSMVKPGESLLDIGCGSATTTECIDNHFKDKISKYKGTDFIDHRIDWCKKKYPNYDFEQQDATKLKEKDKSWDVVWSRHVVDHLPSLEESIDEQLRIAKKRVICILWHSWTSKEEHLISPIKSGDDVYETEYLNTYSLPRTANFLIGKSEEWAFDIHFGIGNPRQRHDSIIHIYKPEERMYEGSSL